MSDTPNTDLTLPCGSVLHDNYIIDAVLGEGGFGITYSATCISSKEKVAVKEYFPSGVALRKYTDDKPMVTHQSGKLATSFTKGMHRFLNEATLLKSFQHLDSIVSVYDVFEENDTAYLVMEYIEGITLKELIQNEGTLPFEELLSLMKPVLLDLHEVHRQGLIHRDISPDNLIVGMDNRLHLIDFGAASFSNPNETKTTTVILKSGYAPPEQYIPDGRTGAWTDVYALCATMYMALTGEKPPEAIRRMQKDDLPVVPASTGITAHQARALYTGLKLNSAERFTTVKLLYQALTTAPIAESTETKDSVRISHQTHDDIKQLGQAAPEKRRIQRILTGGGLLCMSLLVILLFYWGNGNSDRLFKNTSASNADNKGMVASEEGIPTTGTPENTGDTDTDATGTGLANGESKNASDGNSLSSDDTLTTSQILTMVNLVGISLDIAKADLSKLDNSIQVKITEEYNDKYASGYVISQSIAENTQFTRGQITQIQLVVSKGKAPVATNNNNSSSQKSTQSSTGYTVKGSDDSNAGAEDDGYTTIRLGE